MLILTRKVGESIMVGEVEVMVASTRRDGRISLGIRGPRNIPVHRKEIYDDLKREEAKRVAAPAK